MPRSGCTTATGASIHHWLLLGFMLAVAATCGALATALSMRSSAFAVSALRPVASPGRPPSPWLPPPARPAVAPAGELGTARPGGLRRLRAFRSTLPPPPPAPPSRPLQLLAAALWGVLGMVVVAIGWAVRRRPAPVWATLQFGADEIDPAHDYYADLGIRSDATQEDIRKTFRRLAREQHPDIVGAKADPARFCAIKRAYDILSNPADRQRYNAMRAYGKPVLRRTAAAGAAVRQRQEPARAPTPYSRSYSNTDPYASPYAYATAPPAGEPRRGFGDSIMDGLGNAVGWGLQLFRRPVKTARAGAVQLDVELAKALLKELNWQGFNEVRAAAGPNVERLYMRPYRRFELLVCTCLKATRRMELIERDNPAVRICAVASDGTGVQRVVAGPALIPYAFPGPTGAFMQRFRESLRDVMEEVGGGGMYGS